MWDDSGNQVASVADQRTYGTNKAKVNAVPTPIRHQSGNTGSNRLQALIRRSLPKAATLAVALLYNSYPAILRAE